METPIEITGLFTYPIKSCRGLSHASVNLDEFGPAWDRRWMLVDSEGGFITQRTYPRLAQVSVSVCESDLVVETAGCAGLRVPLESDRGVSRRVIVWRDGCDAWDEGNDAGAWFTNLLGVPIRLVRMVDSFVRPASPQWVSFSARVSFADAFPLLLANEASLVDLNRRLVDRGADRVAMNRFRPNIVIRGAPAWAEDGWKQIRVGSLLLDVVKPCTRCVMTTTDQQTGEIPDRAEPLATLATFRRWENSVVFAQNVAHHGAGELSIGDAVEVLS